MLEAEPKKITPLTPDQRVLVAQHVRLAYKFANDFCRRHPKIDIGDLTGPALEGLCLAAQKYQSSHGAKFITYAKTYIRGYVFNQVKDKLDIIRIPRWRNKKMKQVFQSLNKDSDEAPFDEWISSQKAAASNTTDTRDIANLDMEVTLVALEACLTPLQFAIVRDRAAGLDWNVIAAKYGSSQQSVNQAYHRGIVKARRSLKRVK